MNRDLVIVERHGSLVIVTLNDPARRNAMGDAMRSQLIEVIEEMNVEHDSGLRAVVITGANGAFCAGGDLSSMPPPSRAEGLARLGRVGRLVHLIRAAPVPWIAAVEGPAAGLAVGLSSACDVVVAGRTSKFLVPFAQLGLVPDGAALMSVAERMGSARAKAWFLRANPLDGEQAAGLGLADEVVDDGSALARAKAIADELSGRAPGSTAAIKNYYDSVPRTLADTLAFESDRQLACYWSADFAEGKAAFAERRPPRFG